MRLSRVLRVERLALGLLLRPVRRSGAGAVLHCTRSRAHFKRVPFVGRERGLERGHLGRNVRQVGR